MNYKEIQKRNTECQEILVNKKLTSNDKLKAIADIYSTELKERYPDLYTKINNYFSLPSSYNLCNLISQFNEVSDKLRNDIVFLYYVILEIKDENTNLVSSPRGLFATRIMPFMYSGSYLHDVFNQNDLVTNFNKKLRPIYERAISEYKNKTGKDILFIEDEAYWNNGHLDTTMNSLHIKCEHMCDLTDFWEIYHILEATMKSKFDNEILSRQVGIDV